MFSPNNERIYAMHTRESIFLVLLVIAALAAGCRTTTERLALDELKTVNKVELASYLGNWYEIARLPAWFQKGCVASSASYVLREDGQIDVVNRCSLDSPDGKKKEAIGIARIKDGNTNARLEVSFFRPFWGDYWIIELDSEYRYAVVGHPSRDYLWILSRCPVMDNETYSSLLEKIKNQGYEIEKIIKTEQPESALCFDVPSE